MCSILITPEFVIFQSNFCCSLHTFSFMNYYELYRTRTVERIELSAASKTAPMIFLTPHMFCQATARKMTLTVKYCMILLYTIFFRSGIDIF